MCLRAAQFHEFVAQLVECGTRGQVAYAPRMRAQLVAARAVARYSPTWPPHRKTAAFAADVAGLPLAAAAGLGAAARIASVALSHHWQRRHHDQARQQAQVLFPLPPRHPVSAGDHDARSARRQAVVGLLSLITVVSWGTWIPLAQAVPSVPQRARTLYVTIGNVMFAGAALAVVGGHLAWGWRSFWLPVAGGVVWTSGNYAAFRASEAIGLARAAGSWTPLNIVVAFVWGAVLFGELDRLSGARFAMLGGALGLVVTGVLVIVRSQDARPAGAPLPRARAAPGGRRSRVPAAATVVPSGSAAPAVQSGPAGPPTAAAQARTATPAATAAPPAAASGEASQHRRGLLWAAAAGVLWGSYFVPAQWAGTSAQVSNFPLAVGILAGGVALALSRRAPVRLPVTGAAANLAAGVLFGIGNLALLGLVSRVGTGVGFTIGQLSLLVNASIGIWVFKVPPPGSRAAKLAMAGILIAGSGGAIIGALR